jgi:hypothetical protein
VSRSDASEWRGWQVSGEGGGDVCKGRGAGEQGTVTREFAVFFLLLFCNLI